MARYQLKIAYDGTEFYGFQRQTHLRTVQAEIEQALTKIGWQESRIIGAGRTDTGVHADGQVVAFNLNWRHSTQKLANAMNAILPRDISVQSVREVSADFNPRYDAKSRTYCYTIYVSPNRNALRDRFAWQIKKPLDIEKMNVCGEMMSGIHDFSAFGTALEEGGITIRQIYQAFWQAEDDSFVFWICANAFLYHMVRRTVKAMVAVGTGAMSLKTFEEHLHAKQPCENGGMIAGLAPACGLSLVEVSYPDEVIQLKD
jgi:tRNA pseudouridine38-40 synthase